MSVNIQTEWVTPAGNARNVPVYSASIANNYLGTRRTIRGTDRTSVRQKASKQLEKWEEQERRQRETTAKQDAIERAQAETEDLDADARETITALTTLLEATLAVDDRINWEELRDRRE